MDWPAFDLLFVSLCRSWNVAFDHNLKTASRGLLRNLEQVSTRSRGRTRLEFGGRRSKGQDVSSADEHWGKQPQGANSKF